MVKKVATKILWFILGNVVYVLGAAVMFIVLMFIVSAFGHQNSTGSSSPKNIGSGFHN